MFCCRACWHRGAVRCIWGKQAHLAARSWGTPQTPDEPGENVTLGEMKQTVWSISCSSLWICTSSSQLKWKRWLTIGGRTVLRRSNGVSGGRDLKDFRRAHIWNIQFCRSTVVFPKFGPELSYMATPLFGGLFHALQEIWVFHFSYCWLPERSPENGSQNWFLTSYDAPPTVPPTPLWHSCKSI